MNIFYIDENPIQAAQWLADDHIRKMQIESAQMLSTAHWLTGKPAPYKPTHQNHPSAKWVRQSIQHYRWLVQHGIEICSEFEIRYDKEHATLKVLQWLQENEPKLPDFKFIAPPQCMPEEFQKSSSVKGYRNFYINDKVKIKGLKWEKLPEAKPEWVYL